MVEEDEHALAVWQGGEIVHVPMPEPTPPSPRWRWMRLLFVGLVLVILSSLLTVGILGALGILRDGSEQAASAGGITQAPEVVEDQSTETSPEIIIITTTPEPPPPTPLPEIQTEIIVVTPTPIPTSPTVPATDTSEPSPTPIPESTEEVDEQATETTPPPEASSPFSLPFVDNFDGGLQSEWEILNGDVFFGNGRLGASTEQVTLSIGDTLTDYEVSFDYWNLNLSSDYLALDVAPKLRYVQLRHVWRWYQFKDTEWVEIVYEPTGVPASGHMAIRREGNTITVLVNGQLHYEYTHNGTLEAGPFVITFGDDTQIDDFTIAAP